MARHRFGAGRVPVLRPSAARASSPSCAPRSGRTCCRSPARGPTRLGRPRRGPTRSTTGSAHVPRRRAAPADAAAAAATGRATGTRCTATSTASSCSRCRSSIGLDEPGSDYDGGEFVVVEQRPRAQSRATSTLIGRGEALVFTTRDRPVRSARGWSTAPMRHGVSVVRAGRRRTLGLVFHDAALSPERPDSAVRHALGGRVSSSGSLDTRRPLGRGCDVLSGLARRSVASLSLRAGRERAWRDIDAHGSARSARRFGSVA